MLEAQRRDHVAMLVHDLRHPLSSLGLVAEILDADDLPDDERRSAVATIRGLCRDMARLIDGVLVASRLEAGVFSIERHRVTVGDVLKSTLTLFAPLASRRRVTLAFEGVLQQSVLADAPKLRQAIDNLIANAFKFTPRGGKIRVRVSREKGADDRTLVVFEISDTGSGVAEAERATIFDRYKQGSRGRAAGGAGLGLAIARGIAEAHGGTISVGAGDLGGASFRLTVSD
jgi:signal transduction histidine kinase